jgi:type IV secretory pathway VirB2 component (pilin)
MIGHPRLFSRSPVCGFLLSQDFSSAFLRLYVATASFMAYVAYATTQKGVSIMSILTIGPAAAFVAFLIIIVTGLGQAGRADWRLPAILSAAFAGFTASAVFYEGLFGFWPEHTDSLWGNQVWFDLLLAFGMAWTALLPRARAAGMTPWFWAVALILTGSVGLLAMLARLQWIEARGGKAVQAFSS